MKRLIGYIVVTIALVSVSDFVAAQLSLKTFTAGEVIKAEEVNQNFQTLASAIEANQLPQSCGEGQIPERSGDNWVCGTDDIGDSGGGDITEVIAGEGLSGGGDAGSVTLNVDDEIARDSEILPAVLDNDGDGSGLDADTLDGQNASDFAEDDHTHDERYSPRLFAVIAADGTLENGAGVTSSEQLASFGDGRYEVIFDRDVSTCAYAVTPYHTSFTAIIPQVMPHDDVFGSGNINGVYIFLETQDDAAINRRFGLTVTC